MAGRRRALYSSEDLAPLINPRSIAVIGASDRPGSLGARAMANLADFRGRIFPVSQHLTEINGLPCYRSILDVPERVDCAVLAIPSQAIEVVVQDCADAGVGSCVIFASGYAEVGSEEGIAAQERLRSIALRGGMLLAGPNTAGLGNLGTGAHCGFAEFPHGYAQRNGTIALVSQSGAVGLGLSQAAMRGTSISHVLTSGNSVDVDVADYLNALADNPAVDGVALVFEGLDSAARLEQAAMAMARAGKPIAVTKLGSSPLGAAAACHHTASVTGSPDDWTALFRRCGMVEVQDMSRLVETAVFLAKFRAFRKPAAVPAVSILSSSGGLGILAADAADRHGVPTPQPGKTTVQRLKDILPSFGSPRNPCDATANATSNPESILRCTEALLTDDQFDALVLLWGKAWRSPCFEGISELATNHGKPVCLVWMSQWSDGPGSTDVEKLPYVSLFRSLDSCMSAIRAWGAPHSFDTGG